jgi:signal peptidase I
MGAVTAVVFGALAVYVGLMVSGQVPTDFELFLFVCTAVSGAYFIADTLVFGRRRAAAEVAELATFDARHREAPAAARDAVVRERQALVARHGGRPWWVEYTSGFFPVIVLVFVLRSFLFEPFRIPSGSMIPTLQVGDLILVNKFAYGVRLPVLRTKIFATGEPARGDVMVFKYPHKPSQDYIKRVVGLPGDVVEYADRRLSINGTPVPEQPVDRYLDESRAQYSAQFNERLGAVEHRIILNEGAGITIARGLQHTHPDACTWTAALMRCKVPDGHYFMMGDNRDNSEDSRFWGFVPEQNIVGRAFFIWMNFGNMGRIGSFH